MFLLQSRPDIARHGDMEARLPARAVVRHRPEMVRPEAARRDIELKIREQPGHVQRPMLRLGRIDRRMAHQYIHDVEAARGNDVARRDIGIGRSEENTSELQSLMRNSYAVLCLKKKIYTTPYEQITYRRTNTHIQKTC